MGVHWLIIKKSSLSASVQNRFQQVKWDPFLLQSQAGLPVIFQLLIQQLFIFVKGSVTVRLYARSQQILFPREDGKQAGLIHPSTRIGLSGNSSAIVKAWQSHDCRYPADNLTRNTSTIFTAASTSQTGAAIIRNGSFIINLNIIFSSYFVPSGHKVILAYLPDMTILLNFVPSGHKFLPVWNILSSTCHVELQHHKTD